jgi:hypothetical protein
MKTLLLSTWSLPAAKPLAEAARRAGWSAYLHSELPAGSALDDAAFYGGTDLAVAIATRFNLALLEPPLDLLARLPASLLLRNVEFAHFLDLSRLQRRAFIKPADALDKCFDTGIYGSSRDIRASRGIDPSTPILLSEPVEWLAEFRCFVCNGEVVASSPYMSFGRPVWHSWGLGGEKARPSQDAQAVCRRLVRAMDLPPTFVVDVGLIEGRGWAVVEFNPAWCSGLLGADPSRVLQVLDHACCGANTLSADDRRWLVER